MANLGEIRLSILCMLAALACSDGPTGPPAPSTPADVHVFMLGPDRVGIRWTHAGTGIDEFRVERRLQGSGSFAQIGTRLAGGRSFEDQGLELAKFYEYRVRACRPESCSAYSSTVTGATDLAVRSSVGKADDISGPQVGIFYVVPADVADRGLDVNGTLATSVASFRNWLVDKSGGLDFRFDTHEGALDIGFFRLSKTNEDMKDHDPSIVGEIQRQLKEAGRLSENRLYIVYYDGGSNYACGGAAWPPNVPGQVAAMYLGGTPSGGGSCGTQGFASTPTSFPRYWEFAALHDLVHTLGIVSKSAPHHQANWPAHVPEGNDLMFSGLGGWQIGPGMVIDVGGDDYFGSSVPSGLPTLNASPYVVARTVAARRLAADAPTVAESAALTAALARLPLHAPFEIQR